MGKYSKDKRDIYYRSAKELGYRARSAFKLLQIDEHYHILDNNIRRVVDLCAAPGGWTQVVQQKLQHNNNRENTIIIAVDLAAMSPLPGTIILQADITHRDTLSALLSLLQGQTAEMVLCDGAPDVLNAADIDEYIQHELTIAALNIASLILQPGGTFIGKVFRGKNIHRIIKLCQCLFCDVSVAKPRASRNSSLEGFVVCRQYQPPQGYTATMDRPINMDEMIGRERDEDEKEAEEEVEIRFVSCVDEYELDADQTYSLSFQLPHHHHHHDEAQSRSPTSTSVSGYAHLSPTAAPIKPPYQTALSRLKQQQQQHQHTQQQ